MKKKKKVIKKPVNSLCANLTTPGNQGTVPIGGSLVVRLDKLRTVPGNVYVNNAVVTTELEVSGADIILPVTMAYVAGSNGRYEGIVQVPS